MSAQLSNSLTLLFLILCCSYAYSSPTNDGKPSSQEVDDLNALLKNKNDNEPAAATVEDMKKLSAARFFEHDDWDTEIILDSKEANLKYDVEVLESGDLKKETEHYEEQFRGPAALKVDTDNFSDEDIEVHALPRPEKVSYLTFLTAFSLFIVLALAIYLVLVTWRRNLDQRYGARILLETNCDDDDFAHQLNSGANSANLRQLPLNPV